MPDVNRFDDDFLFGTATSSHQVEGGNDNNDWWDWERRPGAIHDGGRSGDACGWWAGRAEEDLSLAASLGQTAHRMSLEWSRLEPEPGRYDDAAFARYRAILEHAGAVGLSRLVTVNHFTLPRWAARRGSWLDRGLPERFGALCARCGEELGGLVERWATLNEPSVVAFLGYLGDEWPPGLGDPVAGLRALSTMLEAHARGYRALRRTGSTPVGIVLNAPYFAGASGSPLDRAMARMQDWAFTGVVLEALRTGSLWPPLATTPRRVPGLRGAYDFLGLNYYGRFRVRFDLRAEDMFFGRHLQDDTIHTAHTDWGSLYPEGMTAQLHRFAALGRPVLVTENGVFDNDDARRPDVLVDHLRAVRTAQRQGVDVRGYFHWSLIDNFEWAEGWATHFGLVEVDRTTGERRPRPSAALYAQICRERRLPT